MHMATTDPLAALTEHANDVDEAYEVRARLIEDAREAGYTLAEIAAALGLTPRAIQAFMGRRYI